jgi:voltage-gated sodium channel
MMYLNMHGCDHKIYGYAADAGCISPKPHPLISPLFFVSFVLLGTMIVLNLFIGVIMNAMDEVNAEENEKLALQRALNKNLTAQEQLEEIYLKIGEIKEDLNRVKSRF